MCSIIYILSPAKTLDFTLHPLITKTTAPHFTKQTNELVHYLKKLSKKELKGFLGLSDPLTQLNYQRYQDFDFDVSLNQTCNEHFKQAILAFNGPAYQGLNASSFSTKQLEYAQNHLRILCGLYGILRPLDIIQPYRLEMGLKMETCKGKTLYDYWKEDIVKSLNEDFNTQPKKMKILVNVASDEYFKSIATKQLHKDIKIIHCIFKDNGKIVSVYAKKARGLMCRYLIENQVETLNEIQKFNLEGYEYSQEDSNDSTYVFTRKKDTKNYRDKKNTKKIRLE